MSKDHEPKTGKTKEEIEAELEWALKHPNLNIAWLKSRGLFIEAVGANTQGLHELAAAQIEQEKTDDSHSPESQMGI